MQQIHLQLFTCRSVKIRPLLNCRTKKRHLMCANRITEKAMRQRIVGVVRQAD